TTDGGKSSEVERPSAGEVEDARLGRLAPAPQRASAVAIGARAVARAPERGRRVLVAGLCVDLARIHEVLRVERGQVLLGDLLQGIEAFGRVRPALALR